MMLARIVGRSSHCRLPRGEISVCLDRNRWCGIEALLFAMQMPCGIFYSAWQALARPITFGVS
jgi:hypothetical protein